MWWWLAACGGSHCGVGTVEANGVCVAASSAPDGAEVPGDPGGPTPGATDTGTDAGTGVDADGDGYHASVDCDDGAPDVHPGAVEVCDNGIDEDCDGVGAGCRRVGTVDLQASDGMFEGGSLDDAAWVQDLNGDGAAELAIGGHQEVVVYTGAAGLTQDEDQALVIVPLPLLDLGPVVSGDVDGDGSPDLVVGHPRHDAGANDWAGAITLVTGDLASGNVDIGVTMGTSEDLLLGGHLGLGDLTGDGRPDLVAGTSDGLRLYAGPLFADTALAPSFDWPDGEGAFEVGDIDGDGADDLVALGDGNVYGLFGPQTSGGSLETHEDFTLYDAPDDGYPTDLSLVGDVDGDGTPDLLVAARSSDEACSACGAAYLVTGPAYTGTLAAAAATMLGTIESGDFGAFSTPLGDIDQDGFADVALSADNTPTSFAQAHIFYGPLSGSVYASSAEFVVENQNGDLLLHGGEDFSGDRVPDLFIEQQYAGSLHLFVGEGF